MDFIKPSSDVELKPDIITWSQAITWPEPSKNQATASWSLLKNEDAKPDDSQFLFGNLEADMAAFEQKRKVESFKNRIYLFGICLLIFIVWFNFLEPFQSDYQKVLDTTQKVQAEFDTSQVQLKKLQESDRVNTVIWTWEMPIKILACLQNPTACGTLQWDSEWKKLYPKIDQIRSYRLLTQLSGAKMEVNQKSILKAFNEYYLAERWDTSSSIWVLRWLIFSKPIIVDEKKWLYKIPISATVEFANKEKLDQFLARVERQVDPITSTNIRNGNKLDNLDGVFLMKVESIDYDIVQYQNPQDVPMSLMIYYYRIGWDKLADKPTT